MHTLRGLRARVVIFCVLALNANTQAMPTRQAENQRRGDTPGLGERVSHSYSPETTEGVDKKQGIRVNIGPTWTLWRSWPVNHRRFAANLGKTPRSCLQFPTGNMDDSTVSKLQRHSRRVITHRKTQSIKYSLPWWCSSILRNVLCA